jgi:hypothetical protein
MRKLTKSEIGILSVLRKQPGLAVPVDAIASEAGLTVKRVWVRGRELAPFKLVRAIMHRVYIGQDVSTQYSLQLEPDSAASTSKSEDLS